MKNTTSASRRARNTTLAGFIIFNYEGIPTAGETVFIGGLQLRILRTTRSRIELARVKKL